MKKTTSRKQSLRREIMQHVNHNLSGTKQHKRFHAFVLNRLLNDLFAIGGIPPTWKHLENKSMQSLIHNWRKRRLKDSSIMKYMTVIRTFLKAQKNPYHFTN